MRTTSAGSDLHLLEVITPKIVRPDPRAVDADNPLRAIDQSLPSPNQNRLRNSLLPKTEILPAATNAISDHSGRIGRQSLPSKSENYRARKTYPVSIFRTDPLLTPYRLEP